MRHFLVAILAVCTSLQASLEMKEIAEMRMTVVDNMAIQFDEKDKVFESGGVMYTDYLLKEGKATGLASGELTNSYYRGTMNVTRSEEGERYLSNVEDLYLQWKSEEGYHYDLQVIGYSRAEEAALKTFLENGTLDKDAYYSVYAGRFQTNDPDLQEYNHRAAVYHAEEERYFAETATWKKIIKIYVIMEDD